MVLLRCRIALARAERLDPQFVGIDSSHSFEHATFPSAIELPLSYLPLEILLRKRWQYDDGPEHYLSRRLNNQRLRPVEASDKIGTGLPRSAQLRRNRFGS